ncbi:nol1 nop2 sun family protein [Diplodia corticola]|uniref:Nol1 nop2 sun family protein n=1 Tax=Diplodia corticola TaxID=236234 RepID=A0A1J9QPB8_9PEZI|nr:nol1 nop2 sun family protein [Diplodia corticola]OJD30758.1 nol1 nop2 sun family protein [Diplodia corticola]
MSLYYEAAAILENAEKTGGSLTSRIYGKKGLKSKPTAIYALVTEATKWSAVLKDVVENSGTLKLEKKLTPLLAVLLTHDLLVSKGGVAAPAAHPLKLAITRHKARLSAEFTKLRVKRGFSSLDAFRKHINACAESGTSATSGDASSTPTTITEHPRWVRVNAVRTTLQAQLSTTFAGYAPKASLADVMAAPASAKVLHVDEHIPDLLALPPRADLSRVKAYQAGELIIQDKASCFPAYLLDVQPDDGDIIDGCAAPGNKTTHLAAIVARNAAARPAADSDSGHPKNTKGNKQRKQHIIACERDKRRSAILEKMVSLAGANKLVTVKPRQDFLNLDPTAPDLASVGAILLDPSCSGSGIISRDDDVKLVLPSAAAAAPQQQQPPSSSSKKRKRKGTTTTTTTTTEPPVPSPTPSTLSLPLTEQDDPEDENPTTTTATTPLATRLSSLSAFQLKLLTHAMRFPAARKLTYSTCSVHAQENEHVVLRALRSPVATARGWRVLRREEQVGGMRAWRVRGEKRGDKRGADGDGDDVAESLGWSEEEEGVVREACVRGEKGTGEGTMGFFVVGFVREGEDGDGGEEEMEGGSANAEEVDEEEEDEWNGFSDDE